MAAFWNLYQSLAVDNVYYNTFITPFSFHLMTPLLIEDQNAPTFRYFHADTEYTIYSPQYWVPLYPLAFYNHNAINHLSFFNGAENNYHHQFMPYDDSWVLGNDQEVNHPDFFSGEEINNHHRFMPCDESWILDVEEEEEELNEEELRVMNSLDQDVVVYDSTYDDDDSLSEETVSRYLKTRDHHVNAVQDTVEDQICVVCQDCLFQENGKIAILDCGHEYHSGCIRGWLMRKNCCPLCNATGIRL